MGTHVVVGRGPVGTTTARLLVERGHRVRLVSRSIQTAPGVGDDGIERVAADASDAPALNAATRGADAIYNAVNPAYHRWHLDWPPIAAGLLTAAEAGGSVLVTMGNLYGYGPVDRPMTEDMPLLDSGKGATRVAMWRDALALHRAGRIRTAEARASDFFGPLVLAGGHLGERVVPRVLRGRGVRVLGDPDQPHSWTYVPDVARALARLGTDERAWGRAWHLPAAPPATQREMVALLSAAAGVPPVKVGRLPWGLVRAGGLVSREMGELLQVRYQFDAPFVVDSSAYTSAFGEGPTPPGEAAAATVAWWRERLGAGAASAGAT